MDRKLRDIIYYFCKYYPNELSRVTLVKLIYLTDVEFYRLYNRQATDLIYEFDNHGPFTWDIVDEASKMFAEGLIDILEEPSGFDSSKPKYIYKCKSDYEFNNLDKHTLDVLNNVNSYFSKFGFSDLLDYVYNNRPTNLFKKGDIIDFSLWKPNSDLSAPQKTRIDRIKYMLTKELIETLKDKKFDFARYEEDPNDVKENSLLSEFCLLQSEIGKQEEKD